MSNDKWKISGIPLFSVAVSPSPFSLFPLTLSLMDIESVRKFCLSLPHADEKVQWGNDLLFRIGEKMFAVAALEPSHGVALSFKCTPEKFAELVEQEGIIPAPYMARHHWVGLEQFDALPDRELKPLLTNAYQMVLEKLPKKVRAALAAPSKTGSPGGQPAWGGKKS
jgi:predicted DNA-binding protein (MmcQ/YjbR family)